MRATSKSSSFSFSESEMPIRFGRYSLLERKGTDPVGEEFLAIWGVDEGVDQLRKVRCIYPSVAEDAQFVRLFSQEARELSSLASINVVKVMEVDAIGGIPFVSSEHVEGVTLERLLELARKKGERCPWEYAVYITLELLRGLDYVHKRNDILGAPMKMTHGDVRPANVIISFQGEVKLTNFGSALDFIADEKTNARVQTYRGIYAPPEHSSVDGATQSGDLWGVAAILSVLIGRGDLNADEGTGAGEIEQPVKERLFQFLDRALNDDLDGRFTDAESMRESLHKILQDHETYYSPDGLANWVRGLGTEDRAREIDTIKEMLGQDCQLNLTDTAEERKLGPGLVLDGRYHLLKQLGEGGMGLVFAAEHVGIGRRVALKILLEKVLDDETTIERFRREAQIMGGLGHPNIVHVSDFGVTSDGYYFLAMDLLEGEPLSELVARGPIESSEAARLMAAVCDGLEVAHGAGVVHRDLKPENIFLTKSGPKILDFGIAKRTGLTDEDQSLTNTGFLCGTAEYMAPEHIGGRDPDARGDIYAVGVMLYEALTQKTPFRGRTIGETLHKAMIDKVVPPRKRTGEFSIPRKLEAVCLKALSRNPNMRFASATEMAESLRSIPFKGQTGSGEKGKSLGGGWNAKLWAYLCLSAVLVSAIVYGVVKWANSMPTDLEQQRTVVQPPPVVVDNIVPQPKDEPSVVKLEPETEVDEAPAIVEPDQVNPPPLKPDSNSFTKPTESDKPDQSEESIGQVARVDELIKKGNAELRGMNFKEATSLFNEALELNPGASKAWFGLGKSAFEEGNYKEATVRINRALTINPNRSKWRNYLGKVHMAMGQRDKAIEQWKKVIGSDPKNEEAQSLLQDVGAN